MTLLLTEPLNSSTNKQNHNVTMTLMASCVGNVVSKMLKLAQGYVFSTLVNPNYTTDRHEIFINFLCVADHIK